MIIRDGQLVQYRDFERPEGTYDTTLRFQLYDEHGEPLTGNYQGPGTVHTGRVIVGDAYQTANLQEYRLDMDPTPASAARWDGFIAGMKGRRFPAAMPKRAAKEFASNTEDWWEGARDAWAQKQELKSKKKLTSSMQKAVDLAKPSGELVRRSGGYWTGSERGEAKEWDGSAYTSTSTVEALIKRGVFEPIEFMRDGGPWKVRVRSLANPCGCQHSASREQLAERVVAEHGADASWQNRIPGGPHCVPADFDPDSLFAGTMIEFEHTSDPHIAMEIAMAHLCEDREYYEKLQAVELENPSLSGPLPRRAQTPTRSVTNNRSPRHQNPTSDRTARTCARICR